MKNYARLLGQREEQKTKAADAAGIQLREMAVEVKKQVLMLMDNEMYAEAYSVVQQLRKMLPKDEDLLGLEEEIGRHFS